MKLERIEELRERIREGLVVIAGDIQDVSDIIIIVREKAEQLKAGDIPMPESITSNDLSKPPSEQVRDYRTSPGLSDERALEQMERWVEFLCLPGLDKELDPYLFGAKDEEARFHIRDRLAAGSPKAEIRHACVRCFGAGVIQRRPTTICPACNGTGQDPRFFKPAPPKAAVTREWVQELVVDILYWPGGTRVGKASERLREAGVEVEP